MSARVEVVSPQGESPVIQCGLHKVFPERGIDKIGKVGSLERQGLLDAMGLNALYYYTPAGEVKPTKHEEARLKAEYAFGLDVIPPQFTPGWYTETNHYTDPPENVAGIMGMALTPWGESGLFLQHVGEVGEQAPSYVDIPMHLQELNWQIVSGAIEQMRDSDEPVYVGMNNSAGGLEENDKGLMSVLRPHLQVVKFGKKYRRHTSESIVRARNQPNDHEVRGRMGDRVVEEIESIRREMGENIIDQLGKHDLPNFWGIAEGKADNMGATIAFPGITPRDLMRHEFRGFLKTLFLTVHHQQELFWQDHFQTGLNDIISYVQMQRDRQDLDVDSLRAEFKDMFALKAETDNESTRMQTIRKLETAGRLRHPIGWALMMQFTKEGMFMAITPSLTNDAMGPVESLTYGLKRDAPNPTTREMQAILDEERRVLKRTLGIEVELPLAA